MSENNKTLTEMTNDYIESKNVDLSLHQRHWVEVATRTLVDILQEKEKLPSARKLLKNSSQQRFEVKDSNEHVSLDNVKLGDIPVVVYAVCISSPKQEVEESDLSEEKFYSLCASLYKNTSMSADITLPSNELRNGVIGCRYRF